MVEFALGSGQDGISPRRRILVTGTTGFVGPRLVSRLKHDCDVVAATRRPGHPDREVRAVCVGAIDSRTQWDEALVGIDAVVHVAAIAHKGRAHQTESPDIYREVNALGTLALAAAAARAGVRDFIFLSSIFVNGASSDRRGPFTEMDPPCPVGAYAVSKAEAEKGLEEIAARSGLACTIIRPPLIYGPTAAGNVALLTKALRSNVPLPLASVSNARAFLNVDSLVDFVAWRLAQSNRGSETFIVADRGHLSTPAFIRCLADAMGLKPRLFGVPQKLLASGLTAIGHASMAESLLSSLEVDTSKVDKAGWTPPTDTRAGLRLAFGGNGKNSV
jgi:UDP-glucose 4-epimerase